MVAAFSGCNTAPGGYAGAEIIIIGEVHDNPQHHRRQAEIIRAVKPAAVAFEMLTPEQAAIANQTAARDSTLAEALNWSESGWPPWELYQPVFEAAGNARFYGMAVAPELISRAVREGAATALAQDAARYGLEQPLPAAEQDAREQLQQQAHCGMLPASLLPGMVEAQRLRDAAFARTALEALEADGAPVVVITGTGHARRDWGIPAMLASAAPGVNVVSIGQFEEEPPADERFDQWFIAEPAPREDPCETFSRSRQR